MAELIAYSLGFLYIGVGMSLTTKDIKTSLSYPKAFVWAILCQYLLMPLIAFAACNLPFVAPNVALGIMITIFTPSATSSDAFTFKYKGDVPFSVSMDAISSIVTPFTVPFFTILASQYFYGSEQAVQLDVRQTVLTGFMIILAPFMLGMIIRRIAPAIAINLKPVYESLIGIVLTLLIVLMTLKNLKIVMSKDFLYAFVPCFIIIMFGLLTGPIGKKLLGIPERHSRTLSFQLAIQNGTLPMFIILLLHNEAAIVGIGAYATLMLIMSLIWGYYLEKNNPISRFKGTAYLKVKESIVAQN